MTGFLDKSMPLLIMVVLGPLVLAYELDYPLLSNHSLEINTSSARVLRIWELVFTLGS
jgi:hypothetical protein